mmetsp:Transcript_16905/g.48195  ORF Transcript_16905/g.48195 Transcript_16905/m.48195 type:complete len:212 (-) Transcript_16905:84-719(-)
MDVRYPSSVSTLASPSSVSSFRNPARAWTSYRNASKTNSWSSGTHAFSESSKITTLLLLRPSVFKHLAPFSRLSITCTGTSSNTSHLSPNAVRISSPIKLHVTTAISTPFFRSASKSAVVPTLTEIAYSTSLTSNVTTSSLSSLASSGTWFAASMWRIVWSRSKAAMGRSPLGVVGGSPMAAGGETVGTVLIALELCGRRLAAAALRRGVS